MLPAASPALRSEVTAAGKPLPAAAAQQ
jgi:hypothetical protein